MRDTGPRAQGERRFSNPVKLEWWGTPTEDTTVHDAPDRFLTRFRVTVLLNTL